MLFFKQKTADELRISDWSSDVCSSDRGRRALAFAAAGALSRRRPLRAESALQRAARAADGRAALRQRRRDRRARVAARAGAHAADPGAGQLRALTRWPSPRPQLRPASRSRRSEEHTSELQSLMRISYADFCLKKKKKEKRDKAIIITHTRHQDINHTQTNT